MDVPLHKSYTWVKLYIPIVKLCNSKIFAELCHGSEKISRSSRMSKEWVPDDSGHVKAHHHVCLRKKNEGRLWGSSSLLFTTWRMWKNFKFHLPPPRQAWSKQGAQGTVEGRLQRHLCAQVCRPPAQLAPHTRLAARRRNFWRVFSSRDFRGFKLTAQLQSMRIAY